jgi:hypothetical protein
MSVHKMLGNGFQEVIYQRCLAIELGEAGFIDVGTRKTDFVVENKVIVELKALTNLEDVHLAQTKNYLEAYKMPIGLLINFGSYTYSE